MSAFLITTALIRNKAMEDVVRNIPRPPVDRVIVVANGSTDRTGDIAQETCAEVVRKERCMYDRACLAGIESARRSSPG